MPLTSEEVNALELDGSLGSSVEYKQRYIDTIRHWERRLEYYFMHKSSDRPQELIDLQMDVITGKDVPLSKWVAAIDKGIACQTINQS